MALLSERMQHYFAHCLNSRRLYGILAVASIVLSLPSLWTGLHVDDFVHRHIMLRTPLAEQFYGPPLSMFDFANGDPARAAKLMDAGIMPWWAFTQIKLLFLRPVAALTHWLDYLLWPDYIPLMHLHSIIWYVALVLVVTLLYRRFFGLSFAGCLAALMYAIDDAHAMPVCWIANRNALIAAFFGFLAVVLHDRWRRSHEYASALLAPACLMLALLSNEGAIAATAYVCAYALFIDKASGKIRCASLLPYLAVITVWRILYTFMGYGVLGTPAYIDPLGSPLDFLNALWLRAPVLLLGQWAVAPSDLFILYPPHILAAVWIAAVLSLIVLAVAFVPLFRKDPMARFWGLGMLLSVIPCCTIYPADRLLLFAGAGAMGLLALFIKEVRSQATGISCSVQTGKRLLYWVLIIIHLIVAPLFFPLRIYGFSKLGAMMNTCIENAPLPETVSRQDIVLVNAPNYFFVMSFPLIRALNGKAAPEHVRSLGSNMGFPPVPIRMTRVDAQTLVVAPEGGFPCLLMRDKHHPMPIDAEVHLTGMSVRILKVGQQGWPLEVAYHFSVPLEDNSLIWFEFKENTLIPFTPPAINESITLHTIL